MKSYLARRSLQGGWQLESAERGPFRGGIIIPALAESASIPLLLDALCADYSLPASGLAVLFVVNNREDASAAEKDDNQQTLALLRCRRSTLPFPLLLVDAASGDLALSARDGGVGTARKLGHDLLLPRLDCSSGEPLLISLDADTLVAPGYAGALVSHFAAAGCGGAVIPYSHRAGSSDAENSAIERYELFLRCYVAGLAAAGSPYAFHTVGSAMACTVSAYLRCGGMNKRRAGEDFYFLQALAKTSGVAAVNGTMVFPSPRRSSRVPFGTGRAVGALLAGDAAAVLFHRPESFLLLKEWLALAREGCRDGSRDLPHRAAAVSPVLQRYLVDQGFPLAWERLLQQHRSPERLCKGFDDWFDAFRTMKLLHLLAAELYPRDEPAELLHLYPQVWGAAELSCRQRLELLRQRQNGVAATSLLSVTAAAGSP
jgi:hypothetical protein